MSTTNPTWIDPGANPGLRGERPATNRLSHGTATPYILTVNKASVCGITTYQLIFQALTAANMNITIFWMLRHVVW
jgi:hypothetical protein